MTIGTESRTRPGTCFPRSTPSAHHPGVVTTMKLHRADAALEFREPLRRMVRGSFCVDVFLRRVYDGNAGGSEFSALAGGTPVLWSVPPAVCSLSVEPVCLLVEPPLQLGYGDKGQPAATDD